MSVFENICMLYSNFTSFCSVSLWFSLAVPLRFTNSCKHKMNPSEESGTSSSWESRFVAKVLWSWSELEKVGFGLWTWRFTRGKSFALLIAGTLWERSGLPRRRQRRCICTWPSFTRRWQSTSQTGWTATSAPGGAKRRLMTRTWIGRSLNTYLMHLLPSTGNNVSLQTRKSKSEGRCSAPILAGEFSYFLKYVWMMFLWVRTVFSRCVAIQLLGLANRLWGPSQNPVL